MQGENGHVASAPETASQAPLDTNFFLNTFQEYVMGTILLVILILVLIGAFPSWPHSRKWGYGPSGLTGLIVVVLIVMLLTGRL